MSIGIHFMPRGNLAGVFSYVLIFGFVTTLVAQEPIAIDYPMVRWTFPIPVRGVVNDGTWNDSPSISGDGLNMYWESAREIADLNRRSKSIGGVVRLTKYRTLRCNSA